MDRFLISELEGLHSGTLSELEIQLDAVGLLVPLEERPREVIRILLAYVWDAKATEAVNRAVT